jgi:hypothetical protein
MAENLIDESVQVTEQPKPKQPTSYISGLRDNLVHFYGENNVPDEASFTKKITSDAEYLKGVHANLIHAYGEENVPDINAFSDKVKKKDQTGLPTAQISGEVSAPIGLTLPSKKSNVPDYEKGLALAQKGYIMPNEGGSEQKNEGEYKNFFGNTALQGLTKAADFDIAALKFLRNTASKLPFAPKAQEIYDANGNLTQYGQHLDQTDDYLGKAIKSFKETQIKDQNLLENEYKLPETTGGQIASGVANIAPDLALAALTGGKNLFSGTGTLASIGNLVTGAFVREQAIAGAAKGYNESDNKSAGETFLNTIKEGGKSAGQGALYELAGFGGNKLGGVIGGALKNTTAKEAVNLGARLATFSLGVSNVENLIKEGRLASQDEVLKNLGVSGAMELFHLAGKAPKALLKKGETAPISTESNPDIEAKVASHINDVRAGSALNNFMKATPDVIENLVKSDQTAQNLNLSAMEAVKRSESMPNGEEKSKVLQTASDFTQAADIKHITDLIKNSPDGLEHLAQDLPVEVRDTFMQKAKDIHNSLNPTEIEKQSHVDNIAQAENAIKQFEPLANENNANVKERLDAQVQLDRARKVIDESTKNYKETTAQQEAQRQALQESKLAQRQNKIELNPPTEEQLMNDINNKNFVTFTYNSESEVPEAFKDKISSSGETNGKPIVRVTIPKSLADYELSKGNQPENVKITEQVKPIEEQLKTKENAIQEPSTGSVLQYPQEGIGETRSERERVEPSIEGVEAPKEGEQAKINEEKGLSLRGIKSAETRKINQEANKIEPTDARSAALKYLSGANLSQEAINEIAGTVKRAQLNTGRRELKTQEARLRDYVAKKGEGVGLDEAAHNIWENMTEEVQNKNSTQSVKEALMEAILEHKTKADAAKALVDGYSENTQSAEEAYYARIIEQAKEEWENEQKELEEQLRRPLDEQIEGEASEEHINNLIKQYEAEIKAENQQLGSESERKATEEVSSRTGREEKQNEREAESTLITHAANTETRKKLGLEQPELLSNLTEKERYDKAQEILRKGYDINSLIDKMYNPEEILNPVENAISNLYKQSLLSEIEKNPSDENLALAKKFLDARDQANSRAGATLQSLKGEAPKDTLLDFYVNKMEDNNVDVLTEKQKEEAKAEYEAIKAKLDIVEAKNKELEKLNSELLAQKVIDEQKGTKKSTTKEKRDYTAERKEVIESIKEKLKKARTGESGISAVPVPYAKELIEIAPDVAKLAKLYIEEGAEKLDDVVTKIHSVLKDEISGLQKKDVQDVLAGKYGKPSKARTEIEKKLSDLKAEARLLDKIEEAKQLKPKTEKEKVEQNKTLTDLRKELNKVRKETGYYDESRLKSIIERNKKETQNLKDKLDKGDFAEKEKPVSFIENPEIKKKYPKLFNEYLDAIDAKDEQQHKYELKRAEEQMNSLSKNERIKAQAGKFIKEGFSTVKALKAGVDNSSVFVQNVYGILNFMNYKATGKALLAQLEDAFSEARFRRRIVEVHNNKPLWNLIKESGLDYLDPKGYNQAMREEQFGSTNWLERKIKIGNKEVAIAKYTTAPFERLFTSFSNEFRLQIFLRGAEQLAKEGKTIETNPQEYKDLASYVNNITGRGKIHESLKPSENVISNVIWAPKLLSSTLNLVGAGDLANLGTTKGYYRSMTPRMRKYAITQTAAGIGTGVALMAAYSLLPNKQVDWDPESVTFGQVKDTESGWGYSIFGRLTPIIRYIVMMIMLTKKVGQGKAQVVDPLKETYKFIRGKMQPTAGLISDVMMRKDFSGKPYKLSNVPSDLFEPLFINDLRQQLSIDGTSSLLTKGIPAFYGIKVSNDKMYDKRDLKSLEETVDSSTIDKNSLFNYDENRPVTNYEYKEFIKKRDSLLKEYYKNISENGIPIAKSDGQVENLPLNSKELSKDEFFKELNRLKGMATREAKKELFGLKELTPEQSDLNSKLKEARDMQGIGIQDSNQEEQNQ